MISNIVKDSRLLLEVNPSNLLSFGPDTRPLAMEKLNILIGTNGVGKSNLIEAISLMRRTPGDMLSDMGRGGRIGEWVWKGARNKTASIEVVVSNPHRKQPLRHFLSFRADERGFRVVDERIENSGRYDRQSKPHFYYRFQDGNPVVNTAAPFRALKQKAGRKLDSESMFRDRSILSQRRDPELYPELTYLSYVYEKVRIYQDWAFGRKTVFREPQDAALRNHRLEEDFSNLGLVLNRLRRTSKSKTAVLEGIRDLYEGVSDFDVSVEGGTVQVFLSEGEFTIPATRLSDGTLRYLCLLAILCDPEPPPLICIEEPELGLHPDIIPKVADLLLSASERTQLVVTTHSDILVDAMTDHPETVIVCEKHNGCSEMRRLKRDDLDDWLEKYRLGQLWTKGQLGGTRW